MGVQTYSMPVKAGQWIIFASVGYTTEAVYEFLDAERIPHKLLKGCFEGQPEDSFLVHEDALDKVQHFFEGEHAILWLGEADQRNSRPAWIQYVDKRPKKYIGMFQRQSKEYALKQSGWTFDPSMDCYFIIEPAENDHAYAA